MIRKFLAVFIVIAGMVACCDEDQCPSCDLQPEVGPCDAAFPRYYYDQDSMKCKQFIWGGCGGVVPFETLEECLDCACGN